MYPRLGQMKWAPIDQPTGQPAAQPTGPSADRPLIDAIRAAVPEAWAPIDQPADLAPTGTIHEAITRAVRASREDRDGGDHDDDDAPPSGTVVDCRSRGRRRHDCPAAVGTGTVVLRRQHSDAPCVEGESWGYTPTAIWVDDGCQGEFEIRAAAAAPRPPVYTLPTQPIYASEPPSMQCEAPASPSLQPNERWYLYDPLACAWQLIRDGEPTPDIYQGPSHLYVPQSAPAPRIPLPMTTEAPSWWSFPTAAPIPAEEEEDDGAVVAGPTGLGGWVRAHPYVAGGAAGLAGLLLLLGRRR